MTNQTIEQAVEELSKDWLFAGDEPKEDDFRIHKEFKDFLRQALQDTIDTVSMIVREEEATAYNKIIDTVLEGERQRMRQIVKERITANGTIYDHDADVTYELENILKALTPLNKEE